MDFEHPGIGEDIGEGDRRDGLDRTGGRVLVGGRAGGGVGAAGSQQSLEHMGSVEERLRAGSVERGLSSGGMGG